MAATQFERIKLGTTALTYYRSGAYIWDSGISDIVLDFAGR